MLLIAAILLEEIDAMMMTIRSNGGSLMTFDFPTLEVARQIARTLTVDSYSIVAENGDMYFGASLENERRWEDDERAMWATGRIPATCCPGAEAFGYFDSIGQAMVERHRPCYKCFRDELWYEDFERENIWREQQAAKYGFTKEVIDAEEERGFFIDVTDESGFDSRFVEFLNFADEVEAIYV